MNTLLIGKKNHQQQAEFIKIIDFIIVYDIQTLQLIPQQRISFTKTLNSYIISQYIMKFYSKITSLLHDTLVWSHEKEAFLGFIR